MEKDSFLRAQTTREPLKSEFKHRYILGRRAPAKERSMQSERKSRETIKRANKEARSRAMVTKSYTHGGHSSYRRLDLAQSNSFCDRLSKRYNDCLSLPYSLVLAGMSKCANYDRYVLYLSAVGRC